MAQPKERRTDPLSRALRERDEALEQQAATAVILRIISSSPGDIQPVLKTVAESAARLCGARDASIFRVEGTLMRRLALYGRRMTVLKIGETRPITRSTVSGRAIVERRTVHVHDVRVKIAAEFPELKATTEQDQVRTVLAVPLLRKGKALGAITVFRREVRPFTRRQLALLRTFADQAMIAIENARLFNETKEALEHQKASADILRIVAESVENASPVFAAITQAGQRLVPGSRVGLLVVRDGQLHQAAHSGIPGEQVANMVKHFPAPLDRRTIAGASILERRVIQVADIAEMRKRFPRSFKIARASGDRSLLVVPLLHGESAVGSFSIRRTQPGTFTERQVELARTFADQAVIAIRNAQFFRDIQERNAELKQSLDFQEAGGEILSSISSSITDAKPVFDAIVRNLLRLFGTRYATVTLVRDGQHHLAALQGEPGYEWLAKTYPRPLSDSSLAGRAILSGQVVQMAPVLGNPAAPPSTVKVARKVGFNSIIAAPMMREGKVIGSITTARRDAVPFDDRQVALIKAFADQAVIAIENARLFNETKNALARQTATADILRVLGSSVTDVQPVFDAIVKNCHDLFKDSGVVLRIASNGQLEVRASVGYAADPVPIERTSAVGACVVDGRTIHLPDLEEAAKQFPRIRQLGPRYGYRSGIFAPLMRGGKAIGAIGVLRRDLGAFDDKDVQLLNTFAAQAVIAIENVRLFNETREALEQQTASSEVLGVISSSPTDLKPVFDAILASATRLCDAHLGVLNLYDGEKFRTVAQQGGTPEFVKWAYDRGAWKPSPVTTLGRMTEAREPVQVADVKEAPAYQAGVEIAVKFVELGGARTYLAVPLLKDGSVLGAISIYRPDVRPFTDKQIELVKTFARQAVIAIENARLFNQTKEALEQQTAISEVLRVISDSPADVKPVLDAVALRAAKICDATDARIFLAEGEQYRHAAGFGDVGVATEIIPLNRDTPSGRAIIDRAPQHIHDIAALSAADFPLGRELAARAGWRTILSVPLLRENRALGVIVLRRLEVRPFSEKHIALLKTFADQAAIAIENVRLFNETKEALERQNASAEVLSVISSSISDAQPVFEKIVESCERLFAGSKVGLNIIGPDGLVHAGAYGRFPGVEKFKTQNFPHPATAESATGAAILAGRVIQFADALSGPDVPPYARRGAQMVGFRSFMMAPLLSAGRGLGAVFVGREFVGPFTEKETALLKTFADQAVIAIENARLFNETREALERQKASAEILRVISGSLEDTSPVFEAIVASGARLFEAHQIGINVLDPDGRLALKAYHGPNRAEFEAYMGGESRQAAGVLRLKRRLAHFPDVEAGTDVPDQIRGGCRITGTKAIIYAPMISGGKGIGALWVGRDRVGPFSDKEIALLQTFADQAVIAIQNARLFGDTKEALERQTATSAVLRVISGSPDDLAPVFAEILDHATRLCEAEFGFVFTSDGQAFDPVAQRGLDAAKYAAWSDAFRPHRVPGPLSGLGRLLATKAPVLIADIADDEAYRARDPLRVLTVEVIGARTFLAVPLLKESAVIGAVVIYRREVRPFSQKQLALLQTFADQAVIAIENVRLFNETKEALERQTATAEILKVISESPTDVTPVFDAIAERARVLCGAKIGATARFDGELLHLVGYHGISPKAEAAMRALFPMKPGRGAIMGRCILAGAPVQIADFLLDPEYQMKDAASAAEYRSLLAIPMLQGSQAIGVIVIGRHQPGAFSEKIIALLQTFADQAVIAIENVRLFKELEARTEALTKSVGQLTALGDVGQAISSTLELETVLKTIVAHAVHLTGLDGGSIYEYDERSEVFTLQAAENMPENMVEALRKAPVRKGDGAIGRSGTTLEPVQVPDILDDSYRGTRKELLVRSGYRAILAVPLLRENHLLGAILVNRKTPGPFAPEVVDLLKTFATQSAMAIQNARLFREIAEKGKELEVASEHKSQFLASMSHELRTPLNALLGFNEMILGDVYGEVPADMQPPLAQMQSSGKHLLRLINNVLDLAKIEAGRMELAMTDYSVQDTVESVRSTLEPLAADKGLKLVATVPADIPLAHGDAGRISQCLMNLAGNSLKFTRAGKVEISVEAKNGQLTYRVSDTGIGIPPDKIGSLFTEFKQTDATIAREYGGTGLGLSISKKFIEMHGGRIWVESELDKGSTFIFEIPLHAKTT